MNQPTVALVTLGCGRNEADSAQVGGALAAAGFRLVGDAEAADCLLVNTCTFIEPAREESIETILAACDLPGGRPVLVIGCMAQRYGDELAEAVPEAAAVVGFDDYDRLPDMVASLVGRPSAGRRLLPIADAALSGGAAAGPSAPPTAGFPVRTVPKGPWAYLKIAGGCDRGCTFCTIPSYRGRFASRPLDEIEAEARWLAAQGVRELVCVSENTTSWGKDLPSGRRGQSDLVAAFGRIDGLARVRLMYLQPAEIVPELLDAMAASPVVASYYDLSLQHASGPVLSRMGRSGDAERFLRLIDGIRARDPQATFRSSFIVGFPGESEADIAILAAFLEEAQLDWVGFFTFSPEEGTASATMPGQVPAEEARRRRDHLLEISDLVAEERTRSWLGREVDLLVEDIDGSDVVGRGPREAPETDGEIRIAAGGLDWRVGDLVPVRIVDVSGVDLVAEALSADRAAL